MTNGIQYFLTIFIKSELNPLPSTGFDEIKHFHIVIATIQHDD